MHADRAAAARTDLRPDRPGHAQTRRPAAGGSRRPSAARRRDGEARDGVKPCWRPSTHPPPSRRLSLRSAILRSCGRTAVRRRPDVAGAPRRGTRPALGALLDAMRGPRGPGVARALECLLGGERATRRGEPCRDAETRGGGPPWEYGSAGDPPRSRGIALHRTSIRRRPSPPSHATPPRRLARGAPSPKLVRARPVGRSARRPWCPGESGAA
jgi:hypothetical protein